MNETLRTQIANAFKNTVLGFVRIKRNLKINHLSDSETEAYLRKTILATPLENNALLTVNSYTLTVITAKQITKNKQGTQ